MRTIIRLIFLLLICFVDNIKGNTHFLKDATYRSIVCNDFENRKLLLQRVLGRKLDTIANLNIEEQEAIKFLYAYMPLCDIADYDFSFFYKQVQYAFKAKNEMAWGARIPHDVFRHFVLPYRVNNENLDSARLVLYPILKERLKGLSMYDAALEVNHWCHEYVTYRPADARTSAPLATMRTGLGRCGEESTFTVTALRAAGIPARQCYTPRWAHCDDNHAWVEVWIDGEWKYLGACEPDPELNMGWFSIPSTRCMMVHTKAFGRYNGSEETIKNTRYYSELNLLNHYTAIRNVVIKVIDENNKPVVNAIVKSKLYNYSEYYTLTTFHTDINGCTNVKSGLGDLLVWATDGEKFNYKKCDLRTDSIITICLNRVGGLEYIDTLDIFPPVAAKIKESPSKQKVINNAHRLAFEDSLRNARMSTFMCNTPYDTWNTLPNENLTNKQIIEIITKSEGNYKEISQFLNKHTKKVKGLYLYDYLCSFSDKDLRDITYSILEHHLTLHKENIPIDVYKKGIMPARISNEQIVAWRTLKHYDPPIISDSDNYYNCPISPLGVSKLKHADSHSRDIYYVASCRAQGIPAYLDNATNTIYQWKANKWEIVRSTENNNEITGTLHLTYNGKEPKVPVYYPHFTLQRFENGDFVTFDFEEDPRVAKIPIELELAPGYYCLSTGNRYPNGNVLSRLEFFNVEANTNTYKEIKLRPLISSKAQVLPSISPEQKITPDSITIANYAGVKGMLFINIGDYKEPSKHLLNEMLQQKESFSDWNGNMYIIAPHDSQKTLQLFDNVDIQNFDANQTNNLEKSILQAIGIETKPNYPFVALINNTGEILYHSEGYSIGSAEQILKIINR